MTTTLAIIDEAGNVHGPFATHEEIIKCIDDRALGEQRDPDNERSPGWELRVAVSAS